MNKSKAKGTRAETRVVKYLRDHGFTEAKRIALNGSKDMGDVDLGNSKHVLEIKAGRQAANVSRKLFEEWIHQAREEERHQRETFNRHVHCFLLIIPPNKQLKDCVVYYQSVGAKWRSHMYFDDWVECLKETCVVLD